MQHHMCVISWQMKNIFSWLTITWDQCHDSSDQCHPSQCHTHSAPHHSNDLSSEATSSDYTYLTHKLFFVPTFLTDIHSSHSWLLIAARDQEMSGGVCEDHVIGVLPSVQVWYCPCEQQLMIHRVIIIVIYF